MIHDASVVGMIESAITSQTLRGCRCGMDAAALRTALGASVESRRQGKIVAMLFEGGLIVYTHGGLVVGAHQDLHPPADLASLAGLLSKLLPSEKLLQAAHGVTIGRELRVGNISLEVVGDFINALHLLCE